MGGFLMADDKLSRNPLTEPEDLLYTPVKTAPKKSAQRHRDVLLSTFSLYPEDVEHLNALVAELKTAGQRGANKSRIVRQAIAQFKARDYKPPR